MEHIIRILIVWIAIDLCVGQARSGVAVIRISGHLRIVMWFLHAQRMIHREGVQVVGSSGLLNALTGEGLSHVVRTVSIETVQTRGRERRRIRGGIVVGAGIVRSSIRRRTTERSRIRVATRAVVGSVQIRMNGGGEAGSWALIGGGEGLFGLFVLDGLVLLGLKLVDQTLLFQIG